MYIRIWSSRKETKMKTNKNCSLFVSKNVTKPQLLHKSDFTEQNIYTHVDKLSKQTLLSLLNAIYLLVLMKKYIEAKFTYKYISIFFILERDKDTNLNHFTYNSFTELIYLFILFALP